MTLRTRLGLIGHELKAHSPFTLLGAVTGIVFMLIFQATSFSKTTTLFAIFHPLHVFLSAMVTASLFQLHRKARQFLLILLVGYVGSIGVATLSDCIIPFFGEEFLGVAVPTESATHGSHAHGHKTSEVVPNPTEPTADAGDSHHPEVADHNHAESADHAHEHDEGIFHRLHLGFIEEWYLVNPAALLGIVVAFYLPRSKVPHALHILISTWASASHILMNTQADWTIGLIGAMLLVLFIAVWLPCCVSDIIFPMLFVNPDPNHKECWLGHHH